MQKILKSCLLATAFALSSLAFSTPGFAGEVEDAIADAKEAQKQAGKVGGEWRDTGKMIKQAEKLLGEGKAAEALELAREAEAQAMLGYMQATGQTLDNLHI